MTAGVLDAGSVVLDRESDLELAEAAIPATLKTVETFLVTSPENADLLLLLARGYNGYALGFLEPKLDAVRYDGSDEDVERLLHRTSEMFLRGRAYAMRMLAGTRTGAPAARAIEAGDLAALEEALPGVTKRDVPALFWATFGWASAVNLRNADPEMVASVPMLERVLARLVELDPDYFAGSTRLLQAVYWASKPPMFGGQPDLARAMFDSAMADHGERNLLIPFYYARIYGAQVQDRALFDAMMEHIRGADLTAHPDFRLNNEIARARGAFWREHVEEIIFSEPPSEPATPEAPVAPPVTSSEPAAAATDPGPTATPEAQPTSSGQDPQ